MQQLRQRTPGPARRPTAAPVLAEGDPWALGNAELARQLDLQNAPSDLAASHLLYNDEGHRCDPEEVGGVLPFWSGGWDANTIASQLTQLDDDDMTLTDATRCAAVSALAVHVMAGPNAVRSMALAVSTDMDRQAKDESKPEQVRKHFEVMAPDLRAIADRIADGTATFRDLFRVGDGMKLVADPVIGSGTSPGEFQTLLGLGGGLFEYVDRTFHGWEDAQKVVRELESGDYMGWSLIVAVGTGSQLDWVGHAVNLGVDPTGNVYLFDPWPKEGPQLMMWNEDEAHIKPYFQAELGKRVFQVRAAMAAPP